MREFSNESKRENNPSSSVSWLGSAKHHMLQFGKGVLVAGVVLGGYGMLRRWWRKEAPLSDNLRTPAAGSSAASTQPEPAESLIVGKQDQSLTEKSVGALSSSMQHALIDPMDRVSGIGQQFVPDAATQSSHSLADELEITFHDKEIPVEDTPKTISHDLPSKQQSTHKPAVTTYKIDADKSDSENVTVIVGEEFRIKIPGYTVGKDGKTYYLGTMRATLEDGSPLPSWMQLVPPSMPFAPDIIATVKTSIVNDLAVSGNLVLAATEYNGLQVVDISNPRNAKIIGGLTLSGICRAVVAQKDLALITGQYGGLQFINFSNPMLPSIISKMNFGGGRNGFALRGNLALATGSNFQLSLINISNPRDPKIISQTSSLGGELIVQGDVVLTSSYKLGLQLFNISNPLRPQLISNYTLQSAKGIVAMQGNLVLAVDSSELQFINISDPKQPKRITKVMSGISAVIEATVIQGDLALFATDGPYSLWIFNVSDPTSPQIIAQIKTNSDAFSVAVQKNLLFLGCRAGIKIMDLENWGWTLKGIPPRNELGNKRSILFTSTNQLAGIYQKSVRLMSSSRPYLRSAIPDFNMKAGKKLSYRFTADFCDEADGILPFQNLEFVPGEGERSLPLGLTVDYLPQIGNQAITTGGASNVVVQGNLAFVVSGYITWLPGSLQIIDISNLQYPRIIGNQSFSYQVYGVAVQEDIAITVGKPWGFSLINVSDPTNPRIVSNLSSVSCFAVAIQDNIAVVLGDYDPLTLINITDPYQPRVISSVLKVSGMNMAVRKNLVFVAAFTAGLQIIDISNSLLPRIVGQMATGQGGIVMDVAVQGDLALLAMLSLVLVDIKDLKRPSMISTLRIPGEGAQYVAVQGHLALVGGYAGIQLVDISNPKQPTIFDSIDILGVDVGQRAVIHNNLAFVTSSFGLNILQYGLGAGVLSAQPTQADHGNYFITVSAKNFAGISTNTTFRISVNNPPIWKNPLAARTVTVGQVVSFQLPSNIFWDQDGDALTFNSTLASGAALPDWINFFALPRYQVYTIIPSSSNRGQYNISLSVDDGYYGKAQAWFPLTVPTRAPLKVSDIPVQNAFIWRPFELIVTPETFKDPDGDVLRYRAQLKGARPLPKWLSFDNTTCTTGCRFSGQPGVTDLSDLEVELLARSQGGEVGADFTLLIRTNTLFEDLVKYYSASGAGLVFLNLLARLWRWKKMRDIRTALAPTEVDTIELVDQSSESKDEKAGDVKESQVTPQTIRKQLQNLLNAVDQQETSLVKQYALQYSKEVLKYQKQRQRPLSEIADSWRAIKKIAEEIERRTVRKLGYQDTFIWVEALHQLLQVIVATETHQGSLVIRSDKEQLLAVLNKAKKYLLLSQKQGVQLKHQLELCEQALVSMDDTDSIVDNLCCRDSEMFIEVLKTMIIPPYGALRLIYQVGNIPTGWYPAIIQLGQLAEQSLMDSEKLTELQTILGRQKDWRVLYEGVRLLGEIARRTPDEKLQKQALEGVRGRGLRYYQGHYSFWDKRSSCCDKSSAWVRTRAAIEIESLDQVAESKDDKVAISLDSLQRPLLA